MNTFTQTIQHMNPWILGIIVVWIFVWKGMALWKSARLSHKKWFVALLIVNTFGILEIIYIYFIARKYSVETEEHHDMMHSGGHDTDHSTEVVSGVK